MYNITNSERDMIVLSQNTKSKEVEYTDQVIQYIKSTYFNHLQQLH